MKSRLSMAILTATLVTVVALSGGATGSSATPTISQTGPAPSGIASSSGLAASDPQGILSAVGTGFTYQGRLNTSGGPADGQYDLQFSLYDALTGGNTVGTVIT